MSSIEREPLWTAATLRAAFRNIATAFPFFHETTTGDDAMVKHLDERGDPVTATHESDRKDFSAEEAKQGRWGVPVFGVLVGGLFLALLAWGAVEIWGESTDTDRVTETEQVQPAPSQEQTGSVTSGQPAPTDRDPTAQTGTGGEMQQVSPEGTEK